MKQTILLASSLLIGACATNAPREAADLVAGDGAAFAAGAPSAAAVEPAARSTELVDAEAQDTPEAFTAMRSVTSEEADNGRVCEYRTRPGSHIAERYCYTRQVRAANQERRAERVQERIDALQREYRLQEQRRQQMEVERRRPRGVFGTR